MFQVFPSPAVAPLQVAAGAASALQPFVELADANGRMFVRLVELGAPCAPPGGAAPVFRLRADGGAAVAVETFPTFSAITDPAGAEVAQATCHDDGDGVFRLRVIVVRRGRAWELQIDNRDAQPHGFTWVVADNAPETRQPWIVMPASVDLQAQAGEVLTRTVPVQNRGTGDLTIADRPGPLDSGFELSVVPGAIPPNGCGDLQVRFKAPLLAGPSSATYRASSDDTTAREDPEHNRRMALVADTRVRHAPVELAFVTGSVNPTGTGSHAYSGRFAIVVGSLPAEKKVAVRADFSGTWRDIPATRAGPLPEGRELWTAPATNSEQRFAVKCAVGATTFWDDNGGADYPFPHSTGSESMLLGRAHKVLMHSAALTGGRLDVGVRVQNLAFDKTIGIVYTTDDWATSRTAPATFARTMPSGVEEWRLSVVPGGAEVRFAVFYRVAGGEHWDNNFARNYRVTPSQGARWGDPP